MQLKTPELLSPMTSAASAMMLAIAILMASPKYTDPAALRAPQSALPAAETPAAETPAAETPAAETDVSSGIPLASLRDPAILSTATVQSSKGEKIGEVDGLEIGGAKAVKVAMSDCSALRP